MLRREAYSSQGHLDGVAPGRSGGDGGGHLFSVGLALAVGRPDLEDVLAGLGVPLVDVLAPGVDVELGGEASLVLGLPPSVETSTRSMPRVVAQATPPTGTVPACTVAPGCKVSMRDWGFMGPSLDQPRWIQYAS